MRDDRGSAPLEFLTAGVLLLVPMVYLILALSAVQSAAFATEGAARYAARIAARDADPATARATVERAVAVTLADYGVDAEPEVVIDCAPAGSACPSVGDLVTVTVHVDVPLPLVPAALIGDLPARIPVSARSVQPVSAFGDAG
jgi:Flp pilus assembly protein TadG